MSRDGERTPGADRVAVQGYIDMFGLPVPAGRVDTLAETVRDVLDGLAALWEYDLDGVDSAIGVPTEGRR